MRLMYWVRRFFRWLVGWDDLRIVVDSLDGGTTDNTQNIERLTYRVDELMRALERDINGFVVPGHIDAPRLIAGPPLGDDVQDPHGTASDILTDDELRGMRDFYEEQRWGGDDAEGDVQEAGSEVHPEEDAPEAP